MTPKRRKTLPTERPPGAPPDPWTAFTAIPEQAPGRVRRGLWATGRALVHEYALMIYAACLIAVGTTWPTLRYPMHTLPQDLGDPARQAWQIAWSGHVLSAASSRLWQSNAYFPEPNSFASGNSLFGYAIAGMIGNGPTAAILRYNLLFVLAHALLLIGAYALVRQLGARRTGAAVAAVAFAFAPWRLAQAGHLDIVSAGGIPLALAMLARGHGYSLRSGFRPERGSTGWTVAGWLVATWQLSLGFSLGVPFAYILGLLLVVLLCAGLIRLVRHARKRAAQKAMRRRAGPKATRKRPGPEALPPAATPTGSLTDTTAGKPADKAPAEAAGKATDVEAGDRKAVTGPADRVTVGARTDILESPRREPATRNRWLVLAGRLLAPPKRPVKAAKKSPSAGWMLAVTDVAGALFFAAIGLLIAVPYIRVQDTGSRVEEITFFSPSLHSLLIGPAESRIWGAAHATPRASLGWAAEMSLLPGFALYALALAGLFLSVWRLRHRLLLLAALAVTVILTLGTNFFGGRWTYLPLFGHLPASFDLRIPGRLMLWVTLILAILAAGAADAFVRRAEHFAAQRIPPWPGPWLRLATLTPLLLVALEGWNATAHPVVPAQPAALRTVSGPMLVLPTGELTDQTVQLWTTSKFQKIANGGGNFAAQRQSDLRARVAGFPDAASSDYLISIGVTKVLLLREQAVGSVWEAAADLPVDSLNIRREDLDDAVVFYLN